MGRSRKEQRQQFDVGRQVSAHSVRNRRTAHQMQTKLFAVQSPEQSEDVLLGSGPDGSVAELHHRDGTFIHKAQSPLGPTPKPRPISEPSPEKTTCRRARPRTEAAVARERGPCSFAAVSPSTHSCICLAGLSRFSARNAHAAAEAGVSSSREGSE